MLYVRQGDRYVLRFEDGEVFPDRLLEFSAARGLAAASLVGIGAMRHVSITYYDIEARRYLPDQVFDEQLEVLCLTGNIASFDGEPLVHAHITLGRRDYSVIGGHLRRGIVCPTLEVVVSELPEPMERKTDPAYKLPGLDLEDRF
jgi:predicted DNA-binding protein with PD1-like motif